VADIGAAAESQLYQTKMGREADSASRNRYAWGSELGAASQNFSANQNNYLSEMGWARGDEAVGREQDASLWNSILEMAPGVIDSFKAGSVKPGAVATPSPSAPSSRYDAGGDWGQSTRSLTQNRSVGMY
jgi:hypothetical protein